MSCMPNPGQQHTNHRTNLVVVRAGDASLHEHWLVGDTRNWDLAVDYFGDDSRSGEFANSADYFFTGKGPKYQRLYCLFTEVAPELCAQYECIWLPDDDLNTSGDAISGMFDNFIRTGLAIGQPTLLPGSYYSHAITLRHRKLSHRTTTFVEVMAPIFTTAALRKCLWTFSLSISGWGLDYVWPHLISEGVGMLDNSYVIHTRPVGTGEHYKQLMISPSQELQALCDRLAVPNTGGMHKTLSAVTQSGVPIHGVKLRLLLLFGYPWRSVRWRTRLRYLVATLAP